MRALILAVALVIAFIAPAAAADDRCCPVRHRRAGRSIWPYDAAAAYGYAAPAIRGLFPQPEIFANMVRNGYALVHRHRSFEFGEGRAVDGVIAQKVHIVDADGVAWEALYTLERQPDGSFKITGCSLLKVGQAV